MSQSSSTQPSSIYWAHPLHASKATKFTSPPKTPYSNDESSQNIQNRPSKVINKLRHGIADISRSVHSAFPLPQTRSAKTTRLLRILPGTGSEPIKCDLRVVDLARKPRFEALSYVWGTPDPPDYITCCRQRKSVTPNLGAALRRLRSQEKERVFWVDAICL